MDAAKRVAFNTGITYIRMLLTVGISLFSTRVVLNALGSEDYGIFNLIAGLIAMLSFLNVAMTTSTQRYLSYHQGKNDFEFQRNVFKNSFFIHIVIGLIVVCTLEFLGLFLFSGFLNIPSNKIQVAKFLFHIMSFTVLFTILSVPMTALLNSHENLIVIAIVGLFEVLLKFCIALLLLVVANNKLRVYGMLTAGISLCIFTTYFIYCKSKYKEFTFDNLLNYDKKLVKELTSFAGWNLFGTLCALGRTEGLAILLNIFFGAVINASYGLANQVASQVNFFSVTLLQAINPQIMKAEGSGDRAKMLRLCMTASKFSFYLLALFAVPFIFEMKGILVFWLKGVPVYTDIFCELILIALLCNQLTIGIQSGLQAIGKIKTYQIVVGGLIFLNVPLSYFFLKIGCKAYSVLISYIIIELSACMFRLFFLKKIGNLSILIFVKNVFLREIIPLITIIVCSFFFSQFFHFRFSFIVNFLISSTVFFTAIYLVGLNIDEKRIIESFIMKLKKNNY